MKSNTLGEWCYNLMLLWSNSETNLKDSKIIRLVSVGYFDNLFFILSGTAFVF